MIGRDYWAVELGQQLASASPDLPPQHRRADAGEQQCADAVDVVRVLQIDRIPADHDARRQGAQVFGIEVGQGGQDIASYNFV